MIPKRNLLGYCLRNGLLGLFALGMLHGQSRITCSSNGRRQVCPANTRNGVLLVRQTSSSPCIQGRTWGFDGRGIWVDGGCRAEFALGSAAGLPGRPMPPMQPGRPMTQVVTCSSNNGRRSTCGIPGNATVRILKQISGPPCQRGSTWGTQPGSIWVDRGCRANFEVTMQR